MTNAIVNVDDDVCWHAATYLTESGLVFYREAMNGTLGVRDATLLAERIAPRPRSPLGKSRVVGIERRVSDNGEVSRSHGLMMC